MPTLARYETKDGARFTRLCWTCLENGRKTPVRMPVETPKAAAAMPGKCSDCYKRSLVGVPPLGARLDS
jgi:hypothetical protein